MKKENTLLNTGLIINIISSVGILIASAYYSYFIYYVWSWQDCEWPGETFWCRLVINSEILLPLIIIIGGIIPILSIIYNARAIREVQYRKTAGMLGIMTSIVGGVMVLISHYRSIFWSNQKYHTNWSVYMIIGSSWAIIIGVLGIVYLSQNPIILSYGYDYQINTASIDHPITACLMIGIWIFFFVFPLFFLSKTIGQILPYKQDVLNDEAWRLEKI